MASIWSADKERNADINVWVADKEYHADLTRQQVEYLKSARIRVGTPEYYEYLRTHNIKGIDKEIARNEFKQSVRHIDTINERSKAKVGSSAVSIDEALKNI